MAVNQTYDDHFTTQTNTESLSCTPEIGICQLRLNKKEMNQHQIGS